MNKIPIHLRMPLLVQAGYGKVSRQLFEYLEQDERFLPCVEAINWGNLPYIHNHPKQMDYYKAIQNYQQVKEQGHKFPIRIDHSIPQEFFQDAQINIGFTAGAEIDRVSPEFIHKANQMQLLVVPSEYVKEIFTKTSYTLSDKNTGEQKQLSLETPVSVIPHWFDDEVEAEDLGIDFDTEFNFLVVGTWNLKGSYGEDRKDVANTIKWFVEQFKANPKVGLVAKLTLGGGSHKEKEIIQEKIKEIKDNFPGAKCKIHLVHDNLSDEQMRGLFTHPKVKCLISLGPEGFNLPALEASGVGLPVMAINGTGHKDFLRKGDGFLPVDYYYKEIPESMVWEGVLPEGSKWARADEKNFKKRLRKFYDSPTEILRKAEKNKEWVVENYGKKAVMEQWKEFFDQFLIEQENENDDPPEVQQYKSEKQKKVDELSELVKESENEKTLFIMPQSIGDVAICTAIVNSLIENRHKKDDFYFATKPEYYEILDELVKKHGIKVIEYNDNMMMNELTKEVWDHVYNPGIPVQYNFSNWLMGDGEYAVKLLEEIAKNCNLGPFELTDYCLPVQKDDTLPEQYILISPVQNKESKKYKYWQDIIDNVKEMLPEIEVVQISSKEEDLYDGVVDYRGKSFPKTFGAIKNALFVVSPDSFAQHVATAFSVPSIVLFASTHSNTCQGLHLGNRKPRQVFIESLKTCEPKCYKNECYLKPEGKNCLSHITPESVCAAIKQTVDKINEAHDDEV